MAGAIIKALKKLGSKDAGVLEKLKKLGGDASLHDKLTGRALGGKASIYDRASKGLANAGKSAKEGAEKASVYGADKYYRGREHVLRNQGKYAAGAAAAGGAAGGAGIASMLHDDGKNKKKRAYLED